MTKPDPEVLERTVDLLFTAPDPDERFVSRLNHQLTKKFTPHRMRPNRLHFHLLRFWFGLQFVGRLGIGLATLAIFATLIVVGFGLIPRYQKPVPPMPLSRTSTRQILTPVAHQQGGIPQIIERSSALAPGICGTSSNKYTRSVNADPLTNALLGGSIIKNGPFIFDLSLYCNPGLGPEQQGNQFSEIRGLGIHWKWIYNGEHIPGPVQIYWGLEPYVDPNTAFSADLNPQSSAGSNTGLYFPRKEYPSRVYPNWVAAETELHYTLKVQTTQGTYGARLSFVLKREADGFHIVNPSTEALPFEPVESTPTAVPSSSITMMDFGEGEHCISPLYGSGQLWFTTDPPKCLSNKGNLIFRDDPSRKIIPMTKP